MSTLESLLDGVSGWLALDEAHCLSRLAYNVPADGGTIVEIGSYHGRSTIALLYGAQDNTTVYAIDPHHVHEAGGIPFGPSDMVSFIYSLSFVSSETLHKLRVINVRSSEATSLFMDKPIDLLWIDGSHEYNDVDIDFTVYGGSVIDRGLIAVHDSTGAWEGPTRRVREAIDSGRWALVEVVGSISVLRRRHESE